jgi:hypothetical protein
MELQIQFIVMHRIYGVETELNRNLTKVVMTEKTMELQIQNVIVLVN